MSRPSVLTVLPISRTEYLSSVLDHLSVQTQPVTDMIVVIDCDDSELKSMSEVVEQKVSNMLPNVNFSYMRSLNRGVAKSIYQRRRNIASIHNQLRLYTEGYDYVFSVEDDGLLPERALEKLLDIALGSDGFGMATGVEIGRWGTPYVGAWIANDIHETTDLMSVGRPSSTIIHDIDACGLYCAVISAHHYRQHVFSSDNGLGPDINLGLYLRRSGLRNFIDWSLPVTHLTEHGGEEVAIPGDSESCIVSMKKVYENVWQCLKMPKGY